MAQVPKTRKELLINEDFVKTPDMGDYLNNKLLLDMAKSLNDNQDGGQYFLETPYTTSLGYDEKENILVISGKPTTEAELIALDGDTIYLNYEHIKDGNKSFKTMGSDRVYENAKDYLYQTLELKTDKDKIGIRFLGINAPEIPHIAYFPINSESKYITIKASDLMKNSPIMTSDGLISLDQLSYSKFNMNSTGQILERKPNDKIKFLIVNVYSKDKGRYMKHYYEVMDTAFINNNAKMQKCLLVTVGGNMNDLEYHKQANEAREEVRKMITAATDVLYILDGSALKRKKYELPFAYKKEYEKIADEPLYAFESLWNSFMGRDVAYSRLGYRYFGQEFNKRLLGVCYVKIPTMYGDMWINLSKYIANKFSRVEALPVYNSSPELQSAYDFNSNAFKVWTYDKSKKQYIDMYNEMYEKTCGDDRYTIQEAITGVDLNKLTTHTVMIGDCLLMVPPKSIKMVSQTKSQRVSLLRTKGSMVKTLPKSERILQLDLFFNGEQGINGIPYEQKTPSGETMTYYMNGLRALIAQFKFTPFLPIYNDYINNVLNIEAVALCSYNIETIPNFPRTLHVVVKLQEFDYRQYMPEILPPDPERKENLFTNTFSKTIHFPLLRYYYQKPILAGEMLRNEYENSEPYIKATVGQRTSLQPAQFKDPLINFYVANEEFLKMKKQVKKNLENSPLETVYTFNPREQKFLKQLGLLYTQSLQALKKAERIANKAVTNTRTSRTLYRTTTDYLTNKDIPFINLLTKGHKYPGIYHTKNNGDILLDRQECNNNFLKPVGNELTTIIKSNLFDKNIIKDYKLIVRQEFLDRGDMYLDWGILLDINWAYSGNVDFHKKVTNFLAKDIEDCAATDIFKNDKIFISLQSRFTGKKGDDLLCIKQFSINQDQDLKALSFLATRYDIKTDKNGNIIDQSFIKGENDFFQKDKDIGEMKDNIDLETDNSLIFDKYPIGYPIIKNISCIYNNSFTNTSLKAFDGYASQYIGGSDTIVDIDMETRDEFTVNQLQVLSKICVQRLIDYRKIMTCSPLRISSDFTRLIGVNEVIIESLDIDTVPNFPGLYTIKIRLVSVDRTLRNKEALRKIKDINNAEIHHDGMIKTKNYFDIKNALKKVELYPDLELPTLEELERLGFYFIRYIKDDNRIFPDADFYFSYLQPFSSDFIRESIVKFFNDPDNKQLAYSISGDLFKEEGQLNINLEGKAKGNNKLYDVKSMPNFKDPIYQELQQKIYKQASALTKDNMQGADALTINEKEKAIKKAMEASDILLEMHEILDAVNFDSCNINDLYRICVKNMLPFGKELNLFKEEEITLYNTNKGYHQVKSKNIIKDMNESLKKIIKDILSKPISTSYDATTKKNITQRPEARMIEKDKIFNTGIVNNEAYHTLFNYINKYILKNKTDIKDMNKKLKYDDGTTISLSFFKAMEIIMEGAACGATGDIGIFDIDKKERVSNTDYKPKYFVTINNEKVPYILTDLPGQGVSNEILASTISERKNGKIFGGYGIKKYDTSTLSMIYKTAITTGNGGFLDPYYNSTLSDLFLNQKVNKNEFEARQASYQEGLLNELYAQNAFFRNMLVWFYKLLNEDNECFLPTCFYLIGKLSTLFNDSNKYDEGFWDRISNLCKSPTQRQTMKALDEINKSKEEAKEKQRVEKDKKENKEANKQLEHIRDRVKKNLDYYQITLLNGLFASLATLALTDFNSPIYNSIIEGDLAKYKEFIEKIRSSYLDCSMLNDTELKIRRLFQYLDSPLESQLNKGLKYKNDLATVSYQSKIQRLYLDAADNPSLYLMHSFYDMVVNDMRGRMARAFPTYYMLLIDEGRELGAWQLQDNFYNVSAIKEFQVVRSRKIAADTAKIVMTNLFGTFTTEDEDIKDEYQHTFRDMWDSIFSPKHIFKKEYIRRRDAREMNRAKLRAGARVHLRTGYSADASNLPILFNGCVTEVQPGDMMTIICQGDGVEVSNPAMFNPSDAKNINDIKYNDKLFKSFLSTFDTTTTPREILVNPLTAKGTFIQEIIKDWTDGRLFNSNPFGIVHFGDRHYKEIFVTNGEVEQNIYEAISRPSWSKDVMADTIDYEYSLPSAPEIKVGLNNDRSYWDLMNIAASVAPDFICAIAPFNMRSTIFYGHPRYYYAYDYIRAINGQILEKRKPYQQYHVYTSYTDIINNGITASERDVRTCAVGVYQGQGLLTSKTKTIGPMWLDIDIYPEKQKMTTINCSFQYRHLDHVPFTIPIVDYCYDELSESGGYQIAWRATASGLKNTVKDMYTGELIVLGDPTVKPYDKMMIYDNYEDIQGVTEVETVIHTFSCETGFTTSITPDCIAAIDNKYEQIANATMKQSIMPALTAITTATLMNKMFGGITRSLFLGAQQSAKLGTTYVKSAVNSIGNFIGNEQLANYKGISEGILNKVGISFGVTPTDISIYNSLSTITKAYSKIPTHSLSNGKDVASMLRDLEKYPSLLNDLDPAKLEKQIAESLNHHNLKSKDRRMLEEARDTIKSLNSNFKSTSASLLKQIEISPKDLDIIIDAARKGAKSQDKLKEVEETLKILSKMSKKGVGIKYSDVNPKEFKKMMSYVKEASSYIDDIATDSKLAESLKNISGIFANTKTELKECGEIAEQLKDINKVRKGAGSLKAAIASNILWFVADMVITKSLQEYIERKLKNLQVLTVFPLMKNNKVLTAGLDGNKGSVVGSPTYNEAGFIERMAISFFEDRKGVLGTFTNVLRDIFITTDEMKKTVEGFKRSNGYGIVVGSSETHKTQAINNLLGHLAKNEVRGFEAYKNLYLTPRLNKIKSDKGRIAYNKYKLVNIAHVSEDKSIRQKLSYILDDSILKSLNKKQVFRLAYNENIKNTSNIKKQIVSLIDPTNSNKSICVECKHLTKDNVYDIPFLREDALIVLREIVQRIMSKIQPDYNSSTCNFDKVKDHYIVLHNATRINEERSWYCTGYMFTLEVKNYPEFSNILNEMKKEQKELIEKTPSKTELFSYQQDKGMSSNTFNFFIAPTI